MKELYVDLYSQNNTYFTSITDAVNSIDTDDEYTIKVFPGKYIEKLEITKSNLTIIGMGNTPSDTVISYSDYAFDSMSDGSKRGTFRSYSVFIDANNIKLSNLTIANESGDENTCGQAIALYADGDKLVFDNIRLLGRQDTLFTGPLPLKEKQPGGFIGPKQFSPRINGRHLYNNCYICGNVDFIFGSATAYFNNCYIESLFHGAKHDIQGYATAASTPEGQQYGYVFNNCKFISNECPQDSCYLARPWREYAKTVILNSEIGLHISQEGFNDWNKKEAHDFSFYSCYNCTRPNGEPYTPSAPFSRTIPADEINNYDMDKVLAGNDNWTPLM